jgi:acetyl-CoA synthetase
MVTQRNIVHPSPQEAQSSPYADFVTRFQAQDVAALLSGDLETGLNVCYECCDRHAHTEQVALYWEGHDGQSSVHTFAELRERSARFAHFLQAQGIQPGDRVACLLPRIPELLVVALGVWRAGAVYVPLFTAFGGKAIEHRLERSAARLIVTDTTNRPKLNDLEHLPPVVTLRREPGQVIPPGDFDFQAEMARQAADFPPAPRTGDDPFIFMLTSGTTGLPKGVVVPLRGLLANIVYLKYAVDLRAEDAYWNVADPGWSYGLFYAVVGPLLLGHATHFYEGPFTAESTYRMIDKYGITSLAAAPTAYRLLMAAGADLPRQSQVELRVACSAGEPLNPEVIRWVREHLGCAVYDQYGQTELGMVACNHHALYHPVQPGSMGLAVPGFRMAVLDDRGSEVGPGQSGQLAVDIPASPLYYFQGYWQQDSRDRYHEQYYLTGDRVEVGANGNFIFMGRDDDIIMYAGYRIGPFEVESSLLEHPAVAESAVVGKPDAERGEIVKAFVVLRSTYAPSAALASDLQQHVRQRLSAHAYPREVEFVNSLPKTPSGKIQRFVLRQQAAAPSQSV